MFACRNDEMWSTVGSVTKLPPPAPFAVRIEVLGGEHAQGLAHRAAADAELAREHRLVGQPLAAAELAAHDEVAKLVVDLLVRLADAFHRGGGSRSSGTVSRETARSCRASSSSDSGVSDVISAPMVVREDTPGSRLNLTV